MAMSWYLCKKCSTLIKKDATPSVVNCPGSGHHTWTKLAEVGDTNYQCKKCSATIQAKSTPSVVDCPDGGHHSWTKLKLRTADLKLLK